MDKKKIKSSELVIIKKILGWQVAQYVGIENEEKLKKHALLICVDYDENSFFALMVGDYFQDFVKRIKSTSWSRQIQHIIENYIEGDYNSAYNFFEKKRQRSNGQKELNLIL